MSNKLLAKSIFDKYKHTYDGEIEGLCAVIASDIIDVIGGEPVAGYLTSATGWRRAHWWVELSGEVLDPMGDEYSGEPDFRREEVHRNNNELLRKEYFRQMAL